MSSLASSPIPRTTLRVTVKAAAKQAFLSLGSTATSPSSADVTTPSVIHVHARVLARPTEGEANAELLQRIAAQLKVPKRDIELTHGTTSRNKTIVVTGIGPEAVVARLSEE